MRLEGTYPIWDCSMYYDKDTLVVYCGKLCVASGLGVEPEEYQP